MTNLIDLNSSNFRVFGLILHMRCLVLTLNTW